MASGSNDEKTGAPVPGDAKTERDAEALVPSPSADSPKPHGDKLGNAVGEAAATPPKEKG